MRVGKNRSIAPEQATRARSEHRLGEFRRHKSTLLNYLRGAREHRIQLKPFDAEKSWLDLEYVARLHLGFSDSHKSVSKPDPAKQLDELVTALSQASALFSAAIKEGCDFALLRAWHAEARMTLDSALVFEAGSTRIVDHFSRALQTLGRLEATAKSALRDVRRKVGRPRGPSKLPGLDIIIGLAGVYRRSTGLKPAAGKGLFAEFTSKSLVAMGHRDINQSSLVDAIKRARHRASLHAASANRPSPFARG